MKRAEDSSSPSGAVASMDRWQRWLVAVAGLLTVIVQLWSIIEARWQFALVTLLLVLIIAALYALSHNYLKQHPIPAQAFRNTLIGLLVAVPLLALVMLYLYS